jgi:catechol 2,3-dioxygenase-like lactoylglutathione lyase family enzyme
MESAQPVFTVRSVDEAIRWYRDVLGSEAEFVHEGPGHLANYEVLRKGNAGLHLGLAEDMENMAGQGACNFVTRDFDAAHRSARENSATFYIEPSQIPTGARTFGIKDLDGNLITFVEASRA